MIQVYRRAESQEADWVEGELRAMVLGYERVILDADRAAAELGAAVTLPAVRQDGRLVHGQQELLKYLRELERFAAEWRAFQSDSCYIGEDGEVC
jgi:hypothetical protein